MTHAACLVVVFNHAYPDNIPTLRRLYERRFSRIVFLLPNRRVPDPACFTAYRGSYAFHGLVADAREFLLAQDATVFAENAVAAAERSVEIALTQYREGSVDFQRVLDAERSLVDEQNALIQSRSSIATNLIALYKALGGGWEVQQGQPIVPADTEQRMRSRTDWGDDPLFTPPKS